MATRFSWKQQVFRTNAGESVPDSRTSVNVLQIEAAYSVMSAATGDSVAWRHAHRTTILQFTCDVSHGMLTHAV